jgi:hypothetical protein
MKTYPIPGPLLQVVVNYLQRQPWGEVDEILKAIGEIARSVDFPVPKTNGSEDKIRERDERALAAS